jgi:zinc protease
MERLVVTERGFENQREVVKEERRLRVDNAPYGTSIRSALSTVPYDAESCFAYGHEGIGSMEDLDAAELADVRQFFATYYAPNNATLVITGDVDEAETLQLIQRHYGKIPKARIPRFRFEAEPPQRSERRLELQRPTPAAKLALAYRAPSFRDRDYPALALASEVLFGGRSSRLFSRLVREKELATDLHGSLAPFADAGLYEIWVSLRPGRELATALKLIEQELQRVCTHGVSRAELQKVKNRMELGFLQGMETAAGKAEQLGFFEIVYGDAAALFDRLKALRAVQPEDVQRVARKYFDSRKRTSIAVVPQSGAAA